MIWLIMIIWAFWAWRLIDNFDEDLRTLPWYKEIALALILILGAPFFMIEEILEILIDMLLEENSGE